MAAMNISVILAHPAPGSFNHAIAATANEELHALGHTVNFHDLYEEGFDPILLGGDIPEGALLTPRILAHTEEIVLADGVVIVHPNWWGQPPAILTGWVDRVLRPGVAYRFLEEDSGEGVPVGLLRARTAIILNTSNTPPQRERSVFGDPLELIWRNCILQLCGVSDVRRITFSVVVTSTHEQRQDWLRSVRILLAEAFPGQ